MFNNILQESFMNEALFNEVINHIKQFKSNPNNMYQRIRFKQFCEENHLPLPTFPSEQPAFISPFEIANHPTLLDWFSNQRIKSHVHNNINQYHINCKCDCTNEPECIPLPLTAQIFIKMQQHIKHRGQLFIHNKRLNKCLSLKIQPQNDQFNLIQTINTSEFVIDNIASVGN